MSVREPPSEKPETVLRLYTLAVEMADRVSARRAGANSFFLALQTGLAALLGAFAVRSADAGPGPDRFVLALAVCAGLILAVAWFLLLRSYRQLNAAKFDVITKIEQAHFQVRPFSDEWTVLKRSDAVLKNWRERVAQQRDRYTELGVIERAVPIAFAILYAVLGLHLAGWW